MSWKNMTGREIKRIQEKTYGAFRKLLDYEETGLTPEQVQQLKEKSTARKPIKHGTKYAPIFECPTCGCIDVYGQKNCDACGQKLDWTE